ncbi:MAG TPA: FMN-binding protein [Clostridium sp.]
MVRTKSLSIILSLTMATGILVGCSKNTATSSTGKLVDGVYNVEYENYDSHGYKGKLQLTVSGVKITDVKYDEVMKNGTFKSKDETYKKTMEAQDKVYPEKVYKDLEQQLLSKQTTNIDVVSGATASSDNFRALVKYAINEMAFKGTTTPAKIKASK